MKEACPECYAIDSRITPLLNPKEACYTIGNYSMKSNRTKSFILNE